MISTRGRYALRMMLDLAPHQGEGVTALKDIAARQDISKKYLEQIIPKLHQAGLLQTTRGVRGGYRLTREPKDYTLGEILRTTETGLAAVACMDEDAPQCPRARECLTRPVLEELDRVVGTFLDGVTLEDVLDGKIGGRVDS